MARREEQTPSQGAELPLPLEEEPGALEPLVTPTVPGPEEGHEEDQVRAEVNLLTLPFFALSRKGLKDIQEICYHDVVTRGGKRVEIFWRVSANVRQGFPGPFDKEVHKAIEQILSEQLRSRSLPLKNPIPLGSLYELCRRMGINSSGKNYRRIKEALKRITLTGVESRGAFYCRGRGQWVEDVFHLYERVVFKGERLEDGSVADQNYLYLGSWYLQNINALYLKPLDYAYYRGLRSTVARRLYELLGVKFYGLLRRGGGAQPRIQYRYSTLCQLLPLTRQRHPSKAREKLGPAHEELIKTGFLADVEWQAAAAREGEEPDWLLVYAPGPRAWAEAARSTLAPGTAEAQALAPGSRSGAEGEGAEAEVRGIVEEIVRALGDERSRAFYAQLARRAVEEPRLRDLIYRCLSEVKEDWREGRIRTSKGAVFVDKLKRYCKERGIDLGLKAS